MTHEAGSTGPWRRLLGMTVLLVALCGLLVWGGTVTPTSSERGYPSEEEVGPDPGAYVGEHVTMGGTVVATDPVAIEVEYGTGETMAVTVVGVDGAVASGDVLTVFGTLTDESTVEADRAIVRGPWELWYMYGVSLVGGLWVLGRVHRRWRFDTDRLAFVPRDRPRSLWGDADA